MWENIFIKLFQEKINITYYSRDKKLLNLCFSLGNASCLVQHFCFSHGYTFLLMKRMNISCI